MSFLDAEETKKEEKEEIPFQEKVEVTPSSEPSLPNNKEVTNVQTVPLSQNRVPEKEETNEEKAKVPVIPSLTNGNVPSSKDSLSKSEIKDYIRYLLETNPNLNKKQATFLANHCTPGRFYTIQQFKDFASCVYETARTSMDKLAQEGYYEKLQFKNKFVYSPVKKGK